MAKDWYKLFLDKNKPNTEEPKEEEGFDWRMLDPFAWFGTIQRRQERLIQPITPKRLGEIQKAEPSVYPEQKPLAEEFKEYEELPFYAQLAYESPLLAATALIPGASATRLWQAAGKLPTAGKIAARVPIAPFYGVERGIEATLKLGARGVGATFKAGKKAITSVLDRLEGQTYKGVARKEAKEVATKTFAEIQTGKPFSKTLYRGVAEGAEPNDIGWFGKGEYWSNNPETAAFYAERKGGQVISEVAELKNPYVLEEAVGDKYLVGVANRARTSATKAGKDLTAAEEFASEAIPKALKRKGYDGLIIKTYEGEIEVVRYTGVKPLAPASKAVMAVEKVPVAENPAVIKIKQLIKSSEELWEPTLEQRAVESSVRAAKLRGALQTYKGSEAFRRGLATQAGKMPIEAPIGKKLAKKEQEELANIIHRAYERGDLREWDAVHAWEGLQDILKARIPPMSRLYELERVFGEDFVEQILKKRSFWKKAYEGILDKVLLPRTLLASGDFSAPLRQGLYLLPSHPAKAWTAFTKSVRMFFDPKYYDETVRHLASRKYGKMADDAGLFLGSLARSARGLSAREEAFMSKFAEKIPGVGVLVRASERAYVGYLDMFRASVFDGTVQGWGIRANVKVAPAMKVELTKLARYVNWATGRGWAPKETALLNAFFFSPRLQTSRIGLPFLVTKMLISDSPAMRKMAARDLITFSGAASTAIGLAALGGADVELDPRSADFAKARWGNTRHDLLGGFGQYAVLLTRILTGERKAASGRIIKINRGDTLEQFIRTKGSPPVNMVLNQLYGKTVLGEEVNLERENALRDLRDNLTPMFFQDVWDVAEDEGWVGALKALPGAFGAGVQTYDSAVQVVGEVAYYYSQQQLAKQEIQEMERRHEFDKIQDYIQEHPEIMYGELVSDAYREIQQLEKFKKDIEADPTLEDEVREDILNDIKLQQIEIAVPALLAVDEMKLREELKGKEGIDIGTPSGAKGKVETPKPKFDIPSYKAPRIK